MKTDKKRGRPTMYRAAFCEQAYRLCLLGATDMELAEFFNVSVGCLYKWKKTHKKFVESINAGKEVADARVAERLYERALGYSHKEERIHSGADGPQLVETTKHYPPDTHACMFWLKNRQPRKWRDKIETEHSGPDGGPINQQWTIKIIDVNDDDVGA